MKLPPVFLLAFLFSFFLDCQDNSIIDPVKIDDGVVMVVDIQNLSYKAFISYYPELINLDDRIIDPSHLDQLTEVTGCIRCKHQIMEQDQTPSNQIGVEVNLYFDLYLEPECPKKDGFMKVRGIADARVYFPNDEVLLIERHFRVGNCCCSPLDMFFKFVISQNDIQLVTMELKRCV